MNRRPVFALPAIALAVLGSAMATPADALEFSARAKDKVHWISADGPIEKGDAQKFADFAAQNPRINLVTFNSPGGNLTEALALGEELRSLEFETYIPASRGCYSACFFVFIGGVEREVSETGQLGVHQFSGARDDPAGAVQGVTQLIVGKLLQFTLAMGVQIEALDLALQTPPDEIRVFSRQELERYHIVGKANVVVYGTTYRKGCPWPTEFDLKDDLNLFPACH